MQYEVQYTISDIEKFQQIIHRRNRCRSKWISISIRISSGRISTNNSSSNSNNNNYYVCGGYELEFGVAVITPPTIIVSDNIIRSWHRIQHQQQPQTQEEKQEEKQSDDQLRDLRSVVQVLQSMGMCHNVFGGRIVMIGKNEFKSGTKSYPSNDIYKFASCDENLIYQQAWESVVKCFKLNDNYWYDAIQESINYCNSLAKIIWKYFRMGKMDQVNCGIKSIEKLRSVGGDTRLSTSQLYNELRYICGKFAENSMIMFRCQFDFGRSIFMSIQNKKDFSSIYGINIGDGTSTRTRAVNEKSQRWPK